MEKFGGDQRKERGPDYLPQSETEWLETGKFEIETVDIDGRQIRCALTRANEGAPLITMAGGIPRDPERRKKLPLINKLYGRLALKALDQNESSLLYNQPATGGSSGEWELETIQSRANILAGVSQRFCEKTNSSKVALVSTSAGAYMSVKALERLKKQHIEVPKLVLLSPAAYPEEIEDVPYGEKFSEILRESWDIAESPVFSRLERYVADGGSVFISFFESDDPPIPQKIQEYYKSFAHRLSENGGAISVTTIPGVAHNFRRIGAAENKNVVDNDSVRTTAVLLNDFLKMDE